MLRFRKHSAQDANKSDSRRTWDVLYNYGCIGSETPKQNNDMISGKKPSCCVVFPVWLALPLITTIQGVSPLHSQAVFLLETQI